MSHKGRCFRDRRRTARRKARQDAALADLRHQVPEMAMMRGSLGIPVPIKEVCSLNQVSKQRLVEGYKRVLAGAPIRRRGVM